jgi:tRNA A-37 threonylcarbamoyl transferase component Bud32
MGGYQPLHRFLNHGATRDAMTRNQRKKLACALGRLIGAWHEAGFFHGDMHSGNIMCKLEQDDFAFSWIDNEEGRHYARLPMRKRLHDLDHLSRSRYDIPATDRLRFWNAYAHECGFDQYLRTELMRKVIRMTTRYRARKSDR